MNGIGTILLGWINDPTLGPARVKVLWLTLVFVPVLPITAYAVSGDASGYRFHGEMSVWRFVRRYRWRTLPYLGTVLIESLLRTAVLVACALVAFMAVAWLFKKF